MASAAKAGPSPDGRVQRSERSREAIVGALLDLVGRGEIEPTAEQVAERAGVGIRTVFRHFSDVDSLFVAMSARLRAEALPLLRVEPPDAGLEARARGLARHRIAFFEKVAPFKRSEASRRRRSAFLGSQHAALVRELRDDLLRWLPELEAAPADLLEAVDLVASFEAWDRLRSEQRLGRARAAAVMERAVLALTRNLG